MKARRVAKWVGVLMAFAAGGVTVALADGLRNPPEGAAALGRAGVRLTQGDDPTAITHNPANIMDLKAAETMATATIGYSKRTYTSPQGMSEKSEDPWVVLPAVYAAWPLQGGQYVAGVGLNSPYGQSTTWDDNGLMKFRAADYGMMRSANLNPTLATKLGPNVMAGVGIDILWSDMKFKQSLPWMPMPAGLFGPGSRLTFEGDGWGYGANAGVTWQVTPKQRLAVAYRSAISVDYEGDFSIANPPPPGALPPTVTPSSDFKMEGVEFPAVLGLGYGVQVTPAVRVEANAEWVQHSVNEKWDIDIKNNNALLQTAMGSTTLPQNWDDTWTFGLGADWQLNKEWMLRGGWTYLPTPIPSETLVPVLAEGDKNVLALGLGYKRGAHAVDVAYAYNICDSRDVTDPMNPASGRYETEAHLAAVSYVLSF